MLPSSRGLVHVLLGQRQGNVLYEHVAQVKLHAGNLAMISSYRLPVASCLFVV